MHDGMPYGRIQGQGQGHEPIQGSSIENLQSREVDRQSPTGLIFVFLAKLSRVFFELILKYLRRMISFHYFFWFHLAD